MNYSLLYKKKQLGKYTITHTTVTRVTQLHMYVHIMKEDTHKKISVLSGWTTKSEWGGVKPPEPLRKIYCLFRRRKKLQK